MTTNVATVRARDVMKKHTMTVQVTGTRGLGLRARIAVFLFRAGARILGVGRFEMRFE